MSEKPSFIKRQFSPQEGDSAHFLLYSSITIGFAMGIFPVGVFTLIALLAWVFMRNLPLLTFGVFALTFIAANYLGIPPRHPIGAVILDNGPEALFVFFAKNPMLTHLHIHQYETMGALVLLIVVKIAALVLSKRLSAKYWPDFEGASFRKGRFYSLRNIIILPIALLLVALIVLVSAPTLARDAARSAIADQFRDDVQVEIEAVDFSIFDAQLEITGVKISEPDSKGSKLIVEAESISAEAAFWPLLESRLEISEAKADGIYLAPALLVDSLKEKPQESTAKSKPAIQLPEILGNLSKDIQEISDEPLIKDIESLYDLYRDYFGEKKEEPAPTPSVASTPLAPRSPAYIESALAEEGAPLMVIENTEISNFKLSFDGIREESAVEKAAHYLASTISITNLSSAPDAYGKVIGLSGKLNLDTNQDRAVAISANYMPLAQEGGVAASIEVEGLNIPMPTLLEGLELDTPELAISLLKAKEGFGETSFRARMPFTSSSKAGNLFLEYRMPDADSKKLFGVAIAAQNLPLGLIADQLGELPFTVGKDAHATVSTYGSEGDLIYWGDTKEKMGVSIDAKGFELQAVEGKKVMGLRSEQFCSAFNAITQPESGRGLRLRFGYDGAKERFSLEEPRERALLDGIINAAALSAADLNEWESADFGGDGKIQLTSLDESGVKRTFNIQPAEDDGLANIRVQVNIGKIQVTKAHKPVIGMPANTFQNVWNRSIGTNGMTGVLGFRLTDDEGNLAPRIETGSYKPLVYALLQGFDFKLNEFTKDGNLGGANFQEKSAFVLLPPKDFDPNTLASPDGSGLEGLKVRAVWKNAQIHPNKQPDKIFGLPASRVAYVWNKFVTKEGTAFEIDFQLFNEAGEFSPKPEIDFKKLFEEGASKIGFKEMLSDPSSFLSLIEKDESSRGDYMNYLSRNKRDNPNFGGSDQDWMKKIFEKGSKTPLPKELIDPKGNPLKDIKKKLPKFPGG